MTKEILQIILEASAVLLGLYLAFFKSYFQEKGKNLAMKEDIEEMTNTIEKVKSDIGILTHKKINIATEKYKALIDFNNNYSAWLKYILYVNITDNNFSSENFISKVEVRLKELFYNVSISEAQLEVFFVDDYELNNHKNDLISKTIELSNHLQKFLFAYYIEIEHTNITKQLKDDNYKTQQIQKYYEQQKAVFDEYIKKQLEIYKIISPLNHAFIKKISDRVTTEAN